MNYQSILDHYFNESEQIFIHRTVCINAMIGALMDNTYQELVDVLGYKKEQEFIIRDFIKMIYKQLKDGKRFPVVK